MKKYIKIIIAFIFNAFLWLGLYDNAMNLYPNNCEMTYMFEYPEYFEINLKNSFSNYKLFVYGEGHYARHLLSGKFEGIPVLFIPGNQGSYKQVRSLGSVALRKAEQHSHFHFNYFTVDINEEIGAFYGPVLERQALFVSQAIQDILALYETSKNKPKSVVLVGHSMGGLVARAAVGIGGIPADLVSIIITMATPHARPVIIPDAFVLKFYEKLDAYWFQERETALKHVTLVSLGGGKNDIQVPSALTSTPFADIDGSLLSVPLCWLTTDHLAIVWCKQLVLAVNRALFRSVDASTRQISTSRAYNVAAFKYHLSERFGEHHDMSVIENKIRRTIKTEQHWVELKEAHYSESFKRPYKPRLIAIPLQFSKGTQHVSILFQELDTKSVIFACNLNISSEIISISSGESLHLHSRIVAGNRKEVNIDLYSLQGRGLSHLVALVEPSSEQSSIDLHISDRESVNFEVSAPSLWTYDALIVTEKTPPFSLTLNITVEKFVDFWQSFTLIFTPLDCPSNVGPPVVSLRSSWLDRWEIVLSRNSLEFDVGVATPSPLRTDGFVEIHVVKNPSCTYSVSFQQNYRRIIERITLLYGPQCCAYIACHVLLLLSIHYKRCSEKKGSIFFHLFDLTPITVVPLSKILAFGLSKIGVLSDSSYLEKYGTNIEAMPLILFLSVMPLSFVIISAIRVIVIALGRAHLACESRKQQNSASSEGNSSKRSRSFTFSTIAGVAFIAIGVSTCGSLALFLTAAIYTIKVVKLYAVMMRSKEKKFSVGEESQSCFEFHLIILVLSLLVSTLNLPPLIVWAQNFSFQKQLESDCSLMACGVVITALTLLNQSQSLPRNKKYQKHISYVIHLCAVLVTVFGPVYIYRAHEIIAVTLLITSLHQVIAPEDVP